MTCSIPLQYYGQISFDVRGCGLCFDYTLITHFLGYVVGIGVVRGVKYL